MWSAMPGSIPRQRLLWRTGGEDAVQSNSYTRRPPVPSSPSRAGRAWARWSLEHSQRRTLDFATQVWKKFASPRLRFRWQEESWLGFSRHQRDQLKLAGADEQLVVEGQLPCLRETEEAFESDVQDVQTPQATPEHGSVGQDQRANEASTEVFCDHHGHPVSLNQHDLPDALGAEWPDAFPGPPWGRLQALVVTISGLEEAEGPPAERGL